MYIYILYIYIYCIYTVYMISHCNNLNIILGYYYNDILNILGHYIIQYVSGWWFGTMEF